MNAPQTDTAGKAAIYDNMLKCAQANGFDSITEAIAVARKAHDAAQSAGQEAVAWRSSYVSPLTDARVYYVAQTETRARDLVAGCPHIEVEPLGVISTPVNGGDIAQRLADAEADVQRLHKDKMGLLMKYEFCANPAADAQQVGGDAVRDPFGCLKCEHRECGRYVDGSRYLCHAMRDDACARDAALTSPAKVGGDERQVFEAWVRTDALPFDSEDGSDPCRRGQIGYAEDHVETAWVAWQAAMARAAGLIEQHARDSAELRRLCAARDEARRTAEYWKANHLAGNAEIERLKKLLEAKVGGKRVCPHGIHMDNACGACIPPRGTKVGGDEREAFERKFPMPNECIWTGNGYAATGYSAWDAHKHAERWQGWQARAALSADGGQDKRDAERLSQIAWLIASIFVHGGFKAETYNERELERLLRENGTFFDSIEEYDTAIAAGKAPEPRDDDRRERVRDVLAGALGDSYDCTRTWSAWGIGTMGPHDFSLIANSDDRLYEIADAVLAALPSPKQA